MKVSEFKNKVYEEYKEAIDAISVASKEVREDGMHQDDIGVATDKFIAFVDNNEESIFVNVPQAKARIAELRSQLTEN